MKLYLDSTVPKKVLIRLDDQEYVFKSATPREQDILKNLLSVLEKNKATWQDITQIEVKAEGESFTGVRLGVAITNALAFALGLEVNGQQPPIEPKYDSEPNITISKKNISN